MKSVMLMAPPVSQSLLFFRGTTAPRGPRPPHLGNFIIVLRHSKLGRTPLDEWSARLRDLY